MIQTLSIAKGANEARVHQGGSVSQGALEVALP